LIKPPPCPDDHQISLPAGRLISTVTFSTRLPWLMHLHYILMQAT